ncbi:MAG: CBU_0592 family membrane protein [Marivita sp.]|uniref:CBU_0592 family membrane protein n=1 Tax=Marivita sp. TaxID=2003365 RepID=UPI003EF1F299
MSALLDLMRAYPTALQACGVMGSVIYVGGFALVQSGRTCGNGPVYSASKIVAAILVLVSLVGAFNLGAFLIQIGFITFGLWGFVRRRSGTAHRRSKAEGYASTRLWAERT